MIVLQTYWGLGDAEAWASSVSADDRFGFNCNVRHILPGNIAREAYSVGTKFLAVGY